ncbi:MAG: hypothetical protein FWC50_13765 [Planctomycetaceae bacterium]|nr:hypothetical protein [Planctomycetaceae bacterium]
MPPYQYFASSSQRFHSRSEQRADNLIRFESILSPRILIANVQYHCRSVQRQDMTNRFQSWNHPALFVAKGLYNHCGIKQVSVSALLGSVNFSTIYQYCYRHELRILGRVTIHSFFNGIDDWVAPRLTGWAWSHNALMSQREKFAVRFDIEGNDYQTRFAWRFNQRRNERHQLPVCWNIIPCEFLAKQHIRWDAWKQEFAMHAFAWQSLVRPGWRVLARNIETDKSHDLGFIDQLAVGSQSASPSQNPASVGSLDNIFLPDGEYEISVLTSSLFWKDCFDRTIRTISVRPNAPVSPLPVVYNLRSSVGEGMTTIRWSANQSEVADCVFGVWYSPDSPVDIARPPDNTIWYSNTMTEYQTSFQQNAPAYVAVAPIRTGNQSETGLVKELYLDWSNVPPRTPDDVMILDKPLPAIDPEILERNADDQNVSLWF